MYSLNVPVPGRVERVAADLRPRLTPFDRIRERHSLLCKRLGNGVSAPVPAAVLGPTASSGSAGDGRNPEANVARVRERLRPVLADASPFEVRTGDIDYFAEPPVGSAPVVYLRVESPGLHELHRRLCREFPPVEGFEGDGYVPHVTLARDGPLERAERLAALDLDSVTWTVTGLDLWNAEFRESVARIPLRG